MNLSNRFLPIITKFKKKHSKFHYFFHFVWGKTVDGRRSALHLIEMKRCVKKRQKKNQQSSLNYYTKLTMHLDGGSIPSLPSKKKFSQKFHSMDKI